MTAKGMPCETVKTVYEFFQNLTNEDLKGLAEQDGVVIWQATQGSGDALFTPPGMIVAEKVLNNVDMLGLKFGFVFPDRAALDRLRVFYTQDEIAADNVPKLLLDLYKSSAEKPPSAIEDKDRDKEKEEQKDSQALEFPERAVEGKENTPEPPPAVPTADDTVTEGPKATEEQEESQQQETQQDSQQQP